MKILIITKNWLGDVLFQLPAIDAIAHRYPEARITCMAPARCREILECHPSVERVFVFDEKKEQRSLLARIRFAWKLRREGFDQVYLFHRSRTRAFLMWLAGVQERIGYARGRQCFLTKAVEEPSKPLHHVDYFLHLLTVIGIPSATNPCYRFYLPAEAIRSAENMIKKHHLSPHRFVCFHLGANWGPKRWPVEYFARLADLVYEQWRAPVVVTGAATDLELVREFRSLKKHSRMVSLVAQTSLAELGALFKQAACVVTGDSGPMHIASAVGTPVVALFGPTDPFLTGPRGPGEKIVLQHVPSGYTVPWYGKNLPEGGWLTHIQPEEVFKALKAKSWIQETSEYPGKWGDDEESERRNGRVPKATHILVVTLSNIGDVIMTTPVITALATRFPDAKLTVVTGPKAESLLLGSRFIDRLVVYDKRANSIEQLKFLLELRKNSYAWVIDLRNTLIPYLVNTKKRTSLLRSSRFLSMRQRHLEMIEKVGLEKSSSVPFDFFQEEDELNLLGRLRQLDISSDKGWIVAAPQAASQLKTWKREGFAEVVRRLLEIQTEPILLVGDARERETAAAIASVNPSRIYNLAGKTTLKELAVLVFRCGLLLANDSAVMHLGFEMQKPVVAIFGPTHDGKYGCVGPNFRIVRAPVPCAPCEKPQCRFERQICFEDLRPENVLKACEELLHANLSSV